MIISILSQWYLLEWRGRVRENEKKRSGKYFCVVSLCKSHEVLLSMGPHSLSLQGCLFIILDSPQIDISIAWVSMYSLVSNFKLQNFYPFIYFTFIQWIKILLGSWKASFLVQLVVINSQKISVFQNKPESIRIKDELWLIEEKAMAPHSSTLAWRIPWVEEPGGLQSVGSLWVGHDWATSLSLFTFMHWRRKWQPTPVLLPGESQGLGSLVGCHLWGRTESNMTEVT